MWRRLEARESQTTRPTNAILAHKFIGALPCELSLEENIRYVKDFIREQFTRKGYAADWAIHAPDSGNGKNYHVHIMVALRRFQNGAWAPTKDRFPKNGPFLSAYIKEKQEAFFNLQNRYLRKNNVKAHITKRNGKWTVVNALAPVPAHNAWGAEYGDADGSSGTFNPQATSSGFTSDKGHPDQANQFGAILVGTTRPPRSLTRHGGSWKPSIRHQATRAAAEITRRPKTYAALATPHTGVPWPLEATKDWAEWGHANEPAFYAKWSQLLPTAPPPVPNGRAI